MSDEAHALLDVVWGSGVHSVCYQRRPSPFNVLGFYDTREALIQNSMRLSSQGCDTWWGVNALRLAPNSGRGRSEDVAEVVALYADLDWLDEAHKGAELPSEHELREMLASFEMEVTARVDSGHGLQAYWALTEPVPAAIGATLLRGLHARLAEHGLAPERFDLASVLRLPGTVNYKTTPVEVRLEHINGARYDPAVVMPKLVTPEPPPSTRIALVMQTPSEDDFEVTPIEWLIEHTDIRSEMMRHGWQLHSYDRFEGVQTELWTRPGKPISEGHSARLFESEVLYNWSANAHPLRAGARYDVAEFVAAYEFGGRKDELARHVRTSMMPKRPSAPPWSAQSADPALVASTAPTAWPRLSEGFWAPPEFGHIARAADSRLVSREAVLMSMLTLALLHIPNAITLPPRPRRAVLNGYACLVGRPADGKGSAMDLAIEMLAPPHGTKRTTLGTAEGFVKSFYHADPEHTGKGTPKPVRHWQPILLRTDEIGAFVATAGSATERGASLLAELKQAWSGERLGKGYASDDKGLQVEPLHYRVVALMGIAPEKAEPLFGDAGGGFPERLIFAPAAVIDLPERHEDIPVWPGPYSWRSPWEGWRADITPEFGVEDSVAAAVYLTNRQQRLHLLAVDPLDAHFALVALKVAAGLATLSGRRVVTWADWERAGEVMALSQATRSVLQQVIAETHDQARAQRTLNVAHAEKAKLGVRDEHDQARHAKRMIEVAERIYRYVKNHPDCTLKQMRNALSAMQREVFEEAMDYAKSEGWVIEVEEAGPGGKRRLLSWAPRRQREQGRW